MERAAAVLMAVSASLVTLGLAEGAAQVALWVRDEAPPARFVNDEVWPHDAIAFHEAHPDRMWRTVPNYRVGAVRINSRGFRGPEVEDPLPEGTARILLLGDSSTFGYNVRESDTLSRQLARALEARGVGPVEVINGGVVGYTSWQGRLLFEAVADELQPDVVVVQFGYNDHHTALRADTAMAAHGDPLPAWLRGLAVVRLFAPSGRTLGQDPVPRVGLSEFRENLTAIRARAREIGANAVFLTVPIRPTVPLVESFFRVEASDYGRKRSEWTRQIDLLLGNFESPAREVLVHHFFGREPLDAVVEDSRHAERIRELLETHPEAPVFHYLEARVRESRGDQRGSERALQRSRELDREREVMETYNTALRRWSREQDVPLLDLARIWEEHEMPARDRFLDVVHPSPAGHRINAAALARFLDERELPNSSATDTWGGSAGP